jgi:hypothetical protein
MISLAMRRVAISTLDHSAVELRYTGITRKQVEGYIEDNPPPLIGTCATCRNREWDMSNWAYLCDKLVDMDCPKPCRAWSPTYTMSDFLKDLHSSGAFTLPNDTPQILVDYIEGMLNELV